MIVRPMKLLTSLRALYSLRWLLCWPALCQKLYKGSSIHNLAEMNITCEFNLESTHYLRSCEISNTYPVAAGISPAVPIASPIPRHSVQYDQANVTLFAVGLQHPSMHEKHFCLP